MVMPVMDGLEVLEEMKKIDGDCKVVIASGYVNEANLHEAEEAGMLAFMQKPYNSDRISEILKEIFQSELY
jgi:YesN/AraC family two-component response regulator